MSQSSSAKSAKNPTEAIAIETLYVNLDALHSFILDFHTGRISREDFTRMLMQHARNMSEVSLVLSEITEEETKRSA